MNDCAENVAITKARAMGYKSFKYLALASSYDGQGFDGPCKACKNLISHKFGKDLKLLLVKNKEDIFECQVKDLLPIRSFVDQNSAIQYDEVSVKRSNVTELPIRQNTAPFMPYRAYW